MNLTKIYLTTLTWSDQSHLINFLMQPYLWSIEYSKGSCKYGVCTLVVRVGLSNADICWQVRLWGSVQCWHSLTDADSGWGRSQSDIVPAHANFAKITTWFSLSHGQIVQISTKNSILSYFALWKITSPPSARVAAMRFMPHKIAKQNFIETPLTHFLETYFSLSLLPLNLP